MAKMWAGRTAGETDRIADDFNSSIHFDSRMYRQDITGSMAHAAMLASKHIITAGEADDLFCVVGCRGVGFFAYVSQALAFYTVVEKAVSQKRILLV